MDDEQIIVLSRGLAAASKQGVPEGIARDGISDDLLTQLDADLRDLASRDPERLKAFVHRCAKSHDESDRELAVGVLPGLLDYDYDFTRDTLVFLNVDEDRPSDQRVGRAADEAALAINELRQSRLTPEQIADFDARLAFH